MKKPPSTNRTHRQLVPGTALAALAAVAVKGRAPMTGYSREAFGSDWTDDNNQPYGHNGCDTRNDVLRRDIHQAVIEAGTYGCVVLSGLLDDPYTATAIHFVRGQTTSTLVQIDHVVPLGDAWQKGAQQWSAGERQDFANDPLNLLAVDGSANESKGDGDAATWLPPNRPFWCRYVARQTAVKLKYRLSMTPTEHDAISRILDTCPGQPLPAEPGALAAVVVRATAPPPTTQAPPPPPPSATQPTTPGGSCEPGYSPCLPVTSDLNCGDISNSLKPIHVTGSDPYRLDSDGNGLGCES